MSASGLALVAACQKWSTYLRATGELELITDHFPQNWLRNQRNPHKTFARWILELEEYTYHIEHRPGSENHLPDYLSRVSELEYDTDVQNENVFEDKIYVVETLTEPDLTHEQKQNPEIKGVIEQLMNTGVVSSCQLRGVAEQLKGIVC